MAKKVGRRIISVMNKKGGCGKSTLVRGLASVAIDRGQRVTIFDTDDNAGIYHWKNDASAQGYWHDRAEVIATLSAEEVISAINAIYEKPEEDHLILIDTFGGGSEAQDEMAMESHLIVAPCRPSSQDVRDTTETGMWHVRLKDRVTRPENVPPFRVIGSHVPQKITESASQQLGIMFDSLPMLDDFVLVRACYERMNDSGLLGVVRDKHPNRSLAKSLQDGIKEMGDLLDEFDRIIKENE
ncbi:cellulose biosynthesis protein BcsQ [Paracoccus pantotrophus]|uniref:AAA family ATPase n=1 Tax=Paracoccus pantotrophus TaxID=82367 RepID=A0AAE6TVV4_PARPN|nr:MULTISPECIES: AAA family ATPase [Paracoccus]MDF3906562.1 AAA family ATPase [Paracoccus sp. AS002]QFG36120.1 AAA family ATPase [Paracoccus pantotrophus]RKS42608.1 cellulose biosynthesis protein BcsQ [Paracoccus pantotrophus]